MPIATGVNKQVGYKQETTWGTLAGAASGKLLRRVTANFNLTKETYESGEIRTDYQIADMRHGVRSVDGSLSGELSPGSYADFFGAVLSRDFATVTPITTLSITIATGVAIGSVSTWNVTRAAGSWLTDGIKIGDVIRFTAGTFQAANTAKNMVVLSVTGTVLNVIPLNGVAMAVEGSAVTGATVAVIGKKTFAPTSGHVDRSYTFEEWYSDVPASEVFTGLKVNTLSMALPATGLVTCDFGFTGRDLAQTGSTQYFTAPTAQGTSGIFASVSGVMLVNGAPVALLTSLNININRNLQNATVVGSNSIAELFEGRVAVDGDFSAYFENSTFRDLFVNETEVSLIAILSTGSAGNADFMTVVLPRVKVNSNTRDDGEQGITAQHSFMALLNAAGGAGQATERTTISIQDSLA
jgi:hypothetical protein